MVRFNKLEYAKNWRKTHLGYSKQWRLANIEHARAYSRLRACTLKSRYWDLKNQSKVRNLDLTFTFEDYINLVDGKQCIYCNGSLPPKGSGLDRLNESVGYVHGNCVPCCWPCNDKLGALTRVGFTKERAIQLLKELVKK